MATHPMAAEILRNQPLSPGGGIQGVGPTSFPNFDAGSGPFTEFEPAGAANGVGRLANFINSVPRDGDVTEIYGIDNIPQQFFCAPWDDESERYIMPGMMAFCVQEMDKIENTALILTLPKLNQVLREAYDDLEILLKDGDAHAVRFNKYLTEFGERALEEYNQLKKRNQLDLILDRPGERKDFFEMSTQDHFCWLTKYGILNKIQYLGVVNNTNRAISLEGYRQNNNYVHVNVIMGKRAEVSNLFGDLEHVTSGSILWLLLRRKLRNVAGEAKFCEFVVVPHGCTEKRHPRLLDEEYMDPSGNLMRGYHWTVGSVLVPGDYSPQQSQISAASNSGYMCSENLAYKEHATLPTMYVALGFR